MNKRLSIQLGCFALLAFLLCSWKVQDVQIRQARPAAAHAAAPGGPQDPSELESFLDPIITSYLSEARIPGAVFLMVKDGKIFFAKGYGYANLQEHLPASPDTIWRVMSVSKPVTAISVFQQIESGQLNLDEDVNRYLDAFKLPDTYPQPVTARELLTHTAGFDSDLDSFDAQVASPSERIPLDQYLKIHPPARILPPGSEFLYSNAAYDVAGALVEALTGEAFAEEVDANLFQPLGMKRSSFQQPPPAVNDLAQGYERFRGKVRPVPLPIYLNPPSRGLTTSAADMGRLMLALLNGGHLGSTQVLSPESVRTMLSTAFTYDQTMTGAAYGFEDIPYGNLAVFSKSGSGLGASSHLVLIPEANLGYFLAYNMEADRSFRTMLLNRFMEHYFSPAEKTIQREIVSDDSLRELAGAYRSTSYSHTTAAKWLRISWTDYPRIVLEKDRKLLIKSGARNSEKELVPVAARIFSTADARSEYVFVEDHSGRSSRLVNDLFIFEKVPWYESDPLQHRILIFFFFVFALGTVLFPLAWLIRRMQLASSPWGKRIFFLAGLISLLNLSGLSVLIAMLKRASFYLQIASSQAAHVLLPSAFLLAAALSLATPFLFIYARKAGWLSRTGLVLLGIFSLISLGFIPWLNYWNLLGYRW